MSDTEITIPITFPERKGIVEVFAGEVKVARTRSAAAQSIEEAQNWLDKAKRLTSIVEALESFVHAQRTGEGIESVTFTSWTAESA